MDSSKMILISPFICIEHSWKEQKYNGKLPWKKVVSRNKRDDNNNIKHLKTITYTVNHIEANTKTYVLNQST